MLYEFDAFRSELEKSINAAVKDDSSDPKTLAASYISICRNGAGQQHFERLCRGANEVYSFETKNWVQRTISVGKLTIKKNRMRLTRCFLNKGKAFVLAKWGHLFPPPCGKTAKMLGRWPTFTTWL